MVNILFVQNAQCDLPPLTDHPVGDPGPRSEPGTGEQVAGNLTTRPPHLSSLPQKKVSPAQSSDFIVLLYVVPLGGGVEPGTATSAVWNGTLSYTTNI